MMGKHHENLKERDEDTKVLFKQSDNTMHTSRTFSGASQFTRSELLRIRKKLSQQKEFYVEGGKVKRDLSIETDICVLRRYFKSKRNKMSYREASSAKSRYSNYTIEEFNTDNSACGDNELKSDPQMRDPHYNLDITSLMLDNLKKLMNKWIQKHLIEDNDTKRKIETVFETVLQTIESKKGKTCSSTSTYILDKDYQFPKVDSRVARCTTTYENEDSVTNASGKNFDVKTTYSEPEPDRKIKIISTLSLPRKLRKRKMVRVAGKNNTFKARHKAKRLENNKSILLSLTDPRKFMAEASNFDLLVVSTKSLVRRFAMFEINLNNDDVNIEKEYNRKQMKIFPEYINATAFKTPIKEIGNKFESNTEEDINRNNWKIKCAGKAENYIDVVYSGPQKRKHDIFTMTDLNIFVLRQNTKLDKYVSNMKCYFENKYTCCQCMMPIIRRLNEHNVTVDSIKELEYSNIAVSKKYNNSEKYSKKTRKINSEIKNIGSKIQRASKIIRKKLKCGAKITASNKQFNNYHKNFTYLYRKLNNTKLQNSDFLNHVQDVFNYIVNYKGNTNIQLDIQVNVLPLLENGIKEDFAEVFKQNLSPRETKTSHNLVYNSEPQDPTAKTLQEVKEELLKGNTFDYRPEIIPLLDGAISHAKYMYSRESSIDKCGDNMKKLNNMTDIATMTTDLVIAQEIGELKLAIRELSTTAAKLVKEYLYSKTTDRVAKLKVKSTTRPKHTCNVQYLAKHDSTSNIKNIPKRTMNRSEGIQISSRFKKKMAGLKLKKEPKKTYESENRLIQRSSSYRIIESESIIKVTDMTSLTVAVNDKGFTDEGLHCSLPRSRSLFEVSTDKINNNFLTYCCDHVNPRHIYSMSPRSSMEITKNDKNKIKKTNQKPKPGQTSNSNLQLQQSRCVPPATCALRNFKRKLQITCIKNKIGKPEMLGDCYNPSHDNYEVPLVKADSKHSDHFTVKCYDCNREFSCTSIHLDMEPTCGVPRKVRIGTTRHMTLIEGILYCILMWLPIFLLMYFVYRNIANDKIEKLKNDKLRSGPEHKSGLHIDANSSDWYIKVSDLGF